MYKYIFAAIVLLGTASSAWAGSATGSFAFLNVGQELYETVSGPLVGWISIIALIIAAMTLAFGSPGQGAAKILWAIIVVSFLGTVPTIASALGVTAGAMIPVSP